MHNVKSLEDEHIHPGTPTSPSTVAAGFIFGMVGSAGFTLLPATLPALAKAFDLTSGTVGLVSTLELVGVTGGALLAGLVSRRYPARVLSVVVTAILLICGLSTMLVSSIVVLAGLRFVDGLMAGFTLSLAFSILNTTKNRERNFALNAVFPLVYGTIGFAAIPGLEANFGWHASFIVLCITDAIGLLAAFFIFTPLVSSGKRQSLADMLPNARGMLALGSVILYYAGAAAIYAFSFQIGVKMTGSDDLTGYALSVSQFVGIGGSMLAAVLAGLVSKRMAIACGFVVTLIAMGMLLAVAGTTSYLVGLLAINLAWNFLAGSHITVVGMMDARGSAAAFIATAINGGAAAGPLLGFTVTDESYAALEITSIALIILSYGLIAVAMRGWSEIHPVQDVATRENALNGV